LDGDENQASAILEVVRDIARYNTFAISKELGISYGPSDLSFTDFLLFKWIKETRKR
jgi:hypothetical protein